METVKLDNPEVFGLKQVTIRKHAYGQFYEVNWSDANGGSDWFPAPSLARAKQIISNYYKRDAGIKTRMKWSSQ